MAAQRPDAAAGETFLAVLAGAVVGMTVARDDGADRRPGPAARLDLPEAGHHAGLSSGTAEDRYESAYSAINVLLRDNVLSPQLQAAMYRALARIPGVTLVRGSGCSFCGKDTRQGVLLVAGGLAAAPAGKFGKGACICDECLDLCLEILAEPSPP